jgi:LysR family transcriptional regulator, hydrogen peroxide-inducible genes activator
MELRQLEYLIAVVEESSFSAAARRLHVTQPSISEQIRKLERELKQPLLDRLPRRVIPTPAGQQLVEHARRILAEVGEATRRSADAASGKLGGRLTVGAIPTIAPFLLPRLIPAFERRYPDVELLVIEDTTQRLLDQTLRGEIDLAIASTVASTAHLHVDTLTEESLVLMLPTRHRLTRGQRVSPAILEGERFVALHEMHCLADQSAQFCIQRDLRPPVVMHGSNLFTLSAMVAIGMGVSLVPRMMSESPACHMRGIAYRPFTGAPPKRPLTLMWSLLRYRTLAARAFATMAATMLRGKM